MTRSKATSSFRIEHDKQEFRLGILIISRGGILTEIESSEITRRLSRT